jgi:signal transduction histidine kinase
VEEEKRDCSLGLVSMQERVNLVGGRFSIESKPGEGTRILAIVSRILEKEAPADQAMSATGIA